MNHLLVIYDTKSGITTGTKYICMSCINITWYFRDHFLVMYNTQSGIVIGDALKRKIFITIMSEQFC
jgi:hypothetical protein